MVDPLSFLPRSLRALQSRQRNVTSDGDKVIRTSFTSRFAPSWHDLRHNPRRFRSNFDASSPRSTIPPPLVRIHSRARAFPVPGSACSRDGNVYLSSAIFKLPCERNRARARLASSRLAFRLASPRLVAPRRASSRLVPFRHVPSPLVSSRLVSSCLVSSRPSSLVSYLVPSLASPFTAPDRIPAANGKLVSAGSHRERTDSVDTRSLAPARPPKSKSKHL